MAEPTRVYVDMVGDLFHPGHVSILRAARDYGDQLVVGVLSDETVAAYKRRPVMTMEERVAVIAACRYVDEVIPGSPYRVSQEFLDEHGLAVVVHGDDIGAEGVADVYGPVHAAGRLRLVPRVGDISTSTLLDRIRARSGGS
jgi:cytidyltransferase-like protein